MNSARALEQQPKAMAAAATTRHGRGTLTPPPSIRRPEHATGRGASAPCAPPRRQGPLTHFPCRPNGHLAPAGARKTAHPAAHGERHKKEKEDRKKRRRHDPTDASTHAHANTRTARLMLRRRVGRTLGAPAAPPQHQLPTYYCTHCPGNRGAAAMTAGTPQFLAPLPNSACNPTAPCHPPLPNPARGCSCPAAPHQVRRAQKTTRQPRPSDKPAHLPTSPPPPHQHTLLLAPSTPSPPQQHHPATRPTPAPHECGGPAGYPWA